MRSSSVVEHWQVRKPAIETDGGLVTSQHYLASEIGARVLAEGGNAVDAAVAASFAIGTVEPWMSGLGGGGFMLVWVASERRCYAVDCGMIAPRRLDPADYPLTGDTAADLFGWPAVVEDRNLQGYHSITVPGLVDGTALALERFGTRGWAETLAPAIALAERGLLVDWYATLRIAGDARVLSRYEESRRCYLPDGFAPAGEWGGPAPVVRLGRLAETLKRLAEAGARDFYEGEIARSIAADLAAGGSRLDADDLAGYRARILDAESGSYRGAQVHVAPGLTAGPTLLHALTLLEEALTPTSEPDGEAYLAYADSLARAYENRFATMGDSETGRAAGCTTHLTVVDRDGNMVALTQTLLSLFGSKVMLPGSGILMNNGVMWFDPRPGRPNSIAPGRRPLSNMCPTVVTRDSGAQLALGASGGRRIFPAVFQLASFVVDYGMGLEEAFHRGRIDFSGGGPVICDAALPEAVIERVRQKHPVAVEQHTVNPALYACPNAVTHDPASGRQSGAAYVMSPWATAVAADSV